MLTCKRYTGICRSTSTRNKGPIWGEKSLNMDHIYILALWLQNCGQFWLFFGQFLGVLLASKWPISRGFSFKIANFRDKNINMGTISCQKYTWVLRYHRQTLVPTKYSELFIPEQIILFLTLNHDFLFSIIDLILLFWSVFFVELVNHQQLCIFRSPVYTQ